MNIFKKIGYLLGGAVLVLYLVFWSIPNTFTGTTEPITKNTSYACNCSLTCSEMYSEEAQYQLNKCGCEDLDLDGDGLACESRPSEEVLEYNGTFKGYECEGDCSGHEAGYEWAEDKGITNPDDCGGNSYSFIEGCRAYAEENWW